jgi:hypothetical protein
MPKSPVSKLPAKPITLGVQVRTTGKAIVTTTMGSLYENRPYPNQRPWMAPLTSEQIANRVEAIIRAEHESPPADTRSDKQRKRAEYDRNRPRRHQVTLPFPFKPEEHPVAGFASIYPHAKLPFVQPSRPQKPSVTWRTEKPAYRLVIRRRAPLRPLPAMDDTSWS